MRGMLIGVGFGAGAVALSLVVAACTNAYDIDTSGAGSDAAAADGSIAADAGSNATSDAFVIELDEAGDAALSHDTGPPSDAACPLIHNGATCGADAATCCSSICDETRTCSGIACVAEGAACTNKVALVVASPYAYKALGNCCVNEFCSPNQNSATAGTCSPCVPSGFKAPQRTMQSVIPMGTFPVIYADACCSGTQNAANGICK